MISLSTPEVAMSDDLVTIVLVFVQAEDVGAYVRVTADQACALRLHLGPPPRAGLRGQAPATRRHDDRRVVRRREDQRTCRGAGPLHEAVQGLGEPLLHRGGARQRRQQIREGAPDRHGGVRSLPGRLPVCSASLMTMRPFTMTCSIPTGYSCGSSYVARSATRFGSNTTRSALAPARITPRSRSPNRLAGSPVILCTASGSPRRRCSRAYSPSTRGNVP